MTDTENRKAFEDKLRGLQEFLGELEQQHGWLAMPGNAIRRGADADAGDAHEAEKVP
ncbi:MAG: hypothetical protein ACREF4_06230 [Gammaproteobacteria bacterium]